MRRLGLTKLTTTVCATGVLYASLIAPRAAAADFSNWQFDRGTGSNGTPLCAMLSAVRNRNVGQNIVVKGFKGSENLHIDLYKDTWNIPGGTDVSITLDFGDNQPLTLPAYGDGHILDVELPTEHTAVFLSLVVERPFIQVIFPGGNEGTWVVAAGGARAAVTKLVDCLRRLEPAARRDSSRVSPTQPFGAPTPTQPFGSGTNR